MIGIAHGYGLGGSGSNLWTREAVSALCNNGETVHLMCQESTARAVRLRHRAHRLRRDGRPERASAPRHGRPGRCIVHKPTPQRPAHLRPPRRPPTTSAPSSTWTTSHRGVPGAQRACAPHASRSHGVRAWHVNHTILLSEALRRLGEGRHRASPSCPTAARWSTWSATTSGCRTWLAASSMPADAVFSLNQEIRERLARTSRPDLEPKTVTVRVGVDTERFRPCRRRSAPRRGRPRQRPGRRGPRPLARPRPGRVELPWTRPRTMTPSGRLGTEPPITRRARTPDLEDRLRGVPWDEERVVTFVGRLIPAKGVSALVAAFPLILERHPTPGCSWSGDRLAPRVPGGLPPRPPPGRRTGPATLLQWAAERDQEGARPFATAFLEHLQANGRSTPTSKRPPPPPARQRPLHRLPRAPPPRPRLPLADIAVFPSAVAEASPLVIPEAAACGCLPMGTDFAGMSHSLDSLAPHLPRQLRPSCASDPSPEHTVQDIADNVDRSPRPARPATRHLRDAAVEEYDWRPSPAPWPTSSAPWPLTPRRNAPTPCKARHHSHPPTPVSGKSRLHR
jgi:glycosyltransferase involved in cell wall biosynthesis